MNHALKDPIILEWTTSDLPDQATVAELVARLGTFEVHELPNHIIPYLAAASAEVATEAGTGWGSNPDGIAVALLRIISRGALAQPHATGPHLRRLLEQLLLIGKTPPLTCCEAPAPLDPASRRFLTNWHGFVFDDDVRLDSHHRL